MLAKRCSIPLLLVLLAPAARAQTPPPPAAAEPPPSAAAPSPAAAPPPPAPATPPPASAAPPPPPPAAMAPAAAPPPAPAAAVTAAPPPPAPPHDDLPLRLALQTEGAFGVGTGSFYNHLAGGRVDLCFSSRTSLGAYLGYANLKGANGRAHSALTYAQLEYIAGDLDATLRFPIRFASGYLGGNGPVVRAAFGFAFALSPKVDLVTELFAPTVWLTNNQTLLSMNLSLELAIRL
jgi:hypothetical protein